jgi:hypothetical protein
LPNDKVEDFLKSHFFSSDGPSGLWPYAKGKAGDAKKSIDWNGAKRI